MCWTLTEHASPGQSSLIHSGVQNDYSQVETNGDVVTRTTIVCRWRCCLTATCIITSLLVLIISLIVFLAVIPNIAQTSINSSRMKIQSGVIFNAKSDRFSMNSTIALSDVGSQSAVLRACNASLSHYGRVFGYISLPDVTIDATDPSSNVLKLVNQEIIITDKKIFQTSAASLIGGSDTTWFLSCKTSITVHVGVTLHVSVLLAKSMVLPASPLLHLVASNLDVTGANATHLTSISDITFTKQSAVNFALPRVRVEIAMSGEYVGAGHIGPMEITTGVNTMERTKLLIEKTAGNTEILSAFFSQYIMRKDQVITMTGPFSDGATPSVIDGILNETVLVHGSNAGNLALGGMVNSKSEMGWPRIVNQSQGSTQVRGAYAVMQNPLGLGMKIHQMDAKLDLNYKIAYKYAVKAGPLKVISAECTTPHSAFSAMSIGPGMYPNVTHTVVNVPPKSHVSYLVFAGPQDYPVYPYGRNGSAVNDVCKPLGGVIQPFPFSCCWVGITTAAACYKNKAAQKDAKNAQLDASYIDTRLYGNISVELGDGFRIMIKYEQDFFPLYFGYEIYAGFLTGGEVNCQDFTFF